MGGDTGRLRQEIKQRLFDSGAVAVGFAKADRVSQKELERFDAWLRNGKHAGMEYMTRYPDVRGDIRLLLERARSVITLAYSYHTNQKRNPSLPRISSYAFLPDYHKWIRKSVEFSGVEELLGKEYRDWRLCIDSAPVLERYWAVESGIAIRGRNGAAIVPGTGCEVFLAEIVSTIPFEADSPTSAECLKCDNCMKACPTGALSPHGIDCNSCLSYLTIEHRGDWNDPRHFAAMSDEVGRNTLFGCDRCISACPMNNHEILAKVEPMNSVIEFESGDAPAGSSLKRAKKEGLARNFKNCALKS